MKSLLIKVCLSCIVFILCFGTLVIAGDQKKSETAQSGFFSDYLGQWNYVEKKIKDLAEAIPEEKYSWRPGEGVRSVQEVVVHISGANYYLPSFIGINSPEGQSEDIEKTITEKSGAVSELTKSFEHVRNAVKKMSDADLDKPAEFFGQKSDVRSLLFILLGHTHEHLGQLIAYARMNGVVPPWTAARQAKEKEKDK
jgi:uncharacterized damage-inducible protein DinB